MTWPSQKPGIKHGLKTYWLFWQFILIKIRLLWLLVFLKLSHRVDPSDLWPELCIGSNLRLGFKTIKNNHFYPYIDSG